MAAATPVSLRDRMTPPAARWVPPHPARTTEADRLLCLATDLFGVSAACLVLAGPEGLAVASDAGSRCAESRAAGAALDIARRLFETLAAAGPADPAHAAPGVLEEVTAAHGFLAATPVLSASGRCLGAICLADAGRRSLLTGLQRRLFGAFGELVAPALAAPRPVAAGSARGEGGGASLLQDLADRDADALALFDPAGRCLLRNRRFDALLGTASPGTAPPPLIPAALGREESWLARHIARDLPPVGVYRAALADGIWLNVEERRGPHGRSLLARIEERDAFGGTGDMQLLFERCPFPMFVFDRDTRAILAVNAAALALYGWERDAFLRLDLDGLGPVGGGPAPSEGAGTVQAWTHRTRDGRPLPVSARTTGVDHRGRPAVLVTVTAEAPQGWLA